MIIHLMTFVIFLLLTSMTIVSFHLLSRYYIEVQPNGKELVKGHIFKWWSYYIERIKGYKTIFYINEELIKKEYDLQRLLPKVSAKSIDTLTDDDLQQIENVLLCKVNNRGTCLNFYIEEPIYYLPEWIRKPLSSCPTCMSSFWGTIIYVSFNYCTNWVFMWGNHPCKLFFLLYVIYVVILCLLNSVLYKKVVNYV